MTKKLMTKKMKLGIFLLAAFFQFSVSAVAQQTLGGITGTVVDKSGSVLPDTTVTIVGDQTQVDAYAKDQRKWRIRFCQPADWHVYGHRKS